MDVVAYIKPCRSSLDGQGAALALIVHYLGTGTSDALKSLHCKNKWVFPWENLITCFTKFINILDTLKDEVLTQNRKLTNYLKRYNPWIKSCFLLPLW